MTSPSNSNRLGKTFPDVSSRLTGAGGGDRGCDGVVDDATRKHSPPPRRDLTPTRDDDDQRERRRMTPRTRWRRPTNDTPLLSLRPSSFPRPRRPSASSVALTTRPFNPTLTKIAFRSLLTLFLLLLPQRPNRLHHPPKIQTQNPRIFPSFESIYFNNNNNNDKDDRRTNYFFLAIFEFLTSTSYASSTTLASAECLFHSRDHFNMDCRHSEARRIYTKAGVEKELRELGFLRCVNYNNQEHRINWFFGRPKRNTPIPWGFGVVESPGVKRRISTIKEATICKPNDLKNAVEAYQSFYNFTIDGNWDNPKLLANLNAPRCGNRDVEKRGTSLLGDEDGATPRADNEVAPGFVGASKASSSAMVQGTFKLGVGSFPSGFQSSSTQSGTIGSNQPPPGSSSFSSTLLKKFKSVQVSDAPIPTSIHRSTRSVRSTDRRRQFLDNYIRDVDENDRRRSLETAQSVDVRTPDARERRRRSLDSTLPRSEERGKRSIEILGSNLEGVRFGNRMITWRIIDIGYSQRMTTSEQRAAFALAFRMWSEVIPINFYEDTESDIDQVVIKIAFGKSWHLSCDRQFDGFGGDLAHSTYGRAIHLDDDEQYTVNSPFGKSLLKVAVHEIGHVLGLTHTRRPYSIMFAIYTSHHPNNDFELGWQDRKEIQAIYGVCKLNFDVVFDWVRRRIDGQLIYNTYFFRAGMYWMYENRHNRTRYGDPLLIAPEWKGLPYPVDAFTHIWTFTRDETLFFKGQYVYWYNADIDGVDQIIEPQNISKVFGPMAGTRNPAIPGYIDAVLFDKRDGNLYFFKGDNVYGYVTRLGNEGCCIDGWGPKKLRDAYPPEPGEEPLPSDLDTVYFSYTDRTVYFMKDDDYWKLTHFAYNQRNAPIVNTVRRSAKVWQKWYDICDTS